MNGRDLLFLHDLLVEKANLAPLGITDDHLHFSIGLIGIVILYYVFHPVVTLLVKLKWDKVLAYFSISFILLFLLTLFELYQGITNQGDMEFSDLSSGSLSIIFFGIVLLTVHLYTELKRYIKAKTKKSSVR
ncbi:MAG: hypothetical protein H0Z32_03280 [Bacillaceae bacterium]|nr:hypothetical protein [Bacillaceae bacterium]